MQIFTPNKLAYNEVYLWGAGDYPKPHAQIKLTSEFNGKMSHAQRH